jgi:hypothetical protein
VPTWEPTASFWRDLARLSREEQDAFRTAVEKFVADLPARKFRKGLRVKGVKGASGVYEMTWAGDGRATFSYGTEVKEGEAHVIWRRVGGHDIFGRP